ncbi:MAG: hypothetical protein IKC69_05895, partial [Clostridia bacterium]|nr:hypothetical protein [Clostridia bacterium]
MKTTPAEASALEYARALPLPALVTDQELTPIFRNELARRLLPSKARLRRLLAARLPVEAKNELFFLSVDRVSYLVISFAASGGLRIVAFLENTVPLHTPFAKQMVEEGALVLDELYKARSTALPPLPNSSKESTDRSAALAARCVAVRNRMRSFH